MVMTIKYILTVVSFIIIFILILIDYQFEIISNKVHTQKIIPTRESWKNSNKVILYASYWFGRQDMGIGLGSEIFSKCKYKKCYATHDIQYMPFQKFDAVIFHSYEEKLYDFSKLQRLPHQVFVLTTQESPDNRPMIPFSNSQSRIEFNWTMTYRSDSDIFRPYGVLRKQKTNYIPPTPEEISKKVAQMQAPIAWFVSHCTTKGLREVIVDKLKQFYKIDIYGACGTLTCSKKLGAKCYKALESNYMFYLSFENSYCKDYVTEKIYYALEYDVIPIVFGGCNYNQIFPKNSVINVADYNSLEDLAKYLRKLLENPLEYLKFFEWKKYFFVDNSRGNVLCSLCEKLHQPKRSKFYTDIEAWWHTNSCYFPANISKILYNSTN